MVREDFNQSGVDSQKFHAALVLELASRLAKLGRNVSRVARFALPSENTAQKYLPLLICALEGGDMPPKKDEGDGDNGEDLKARLGKLVDEQKSERRYARWQDQLNRKKVADDEPLRLCREDKTLCKKYSDLVILGDIRDHNKWIKKNFPLLSREAWRPDQRERTKQWEAFCKLAGTNSAEGNIAKQICSLGVGNGGAFGYGDQVCGLQGTGDAADGRRTWSELNAKLLRDISKTGSGARDVTAHCVCDALDVLHPACKDSSPQLLVEALKNLTVADKDGTPLTNLQVALILRKKLEKTLQRPSDAGENLQLVLIKALRDLEDVDSIPLFQELQKKGSTDAVKREATRALTDFGPFASKEWDFLIPDPRLSAKKRADQVKYALEDDGTDRSDLGIGAPAAEAIISAYKMPKGVPTITDKDDPVLAHLDKALGWKHLSVRMAAAKVLCESSLDFDNPVRKKAAEVLAAAVLDPNVGDKARREAIKLLDDSLVSHHLIETGTYTIGKGKNNLFGKDALVVEDYSYQYLWTEDGKVERKPREITIPVGDKTARLKVGLNSISVTYTDDSPIVSRSAKFNEGEIYEVRWSEIGKKGKAEDFVAKRVKTEGKYGKKWVLTVPDRESGLTKEVEIEGTFKFTNDGAFSYVGDDWTEPGSGRIVHKSQGVKDKGVTSYHNKP
jgi:hypothetical protein